MLTMTRYLATVLFAATLLITSAGFASAQDHFAKIDTLLKQYSDYGLFQGSVLVSDHGKVYEKGFGLANKEWDIPNAPDTKFRLGSVTKQFITQLILETDTHDKQRVSG